MKCDHKALFVSREPHNKQDVYAYTPLQLKADVNQNCHLLHIVLFLLELDK